VNGVEAMLNTSKNDNPTWYDRYQPTSLDHCVLTALIRSQLETIIRKRAAPNLLLIGPPGIGKTTTIRCVLEALQPEVDFQMIHGADQLSIKKNLHDILGMTRTFRLFDENIVLFIDELDELPIKDQKSIRPAMYAAGKYNTRLNFVATANCASKIDPALKSRFRTLDFCPPLSFSQKNDPYATAVTDRMCFILTAERKTFDRSDVEQHVQDFGMNIRDCINELQARYDC
jgi:replication factor C subunit 2/4